MSPVTDQLRLPVVRVLNCNKPNSWWERLGLRPERRTKLNVEAIPVRPPCPGIHDRVAGSQLRFQQRLQLRAQLVDSFCIDRVHGFTQRPASLVRGR